MYKTLSELQVLVLPQVSNALQLYERSSGLSEADIDTIEFIISSMLGRVQEHMMDSTGPEAYIPDDPEACSPDKTHKQHVLESKIPDSSTKKRAILGLRPATFVLSVLLVVVLVTAAIGGGVGGTLAVKKAREYDFLFIKLTSDETSNRLMINDQRYSTLTAPT
ncbi:uncharacterized protein CLUP02_16015 [Colletotrichum lupini]|uniref:Uncharacterized protein n=1 Tax=Colletotrichum lupini TaxID=145971 RepID=A0A9Q8WPR8_9PEZI|nr:uncharacterized protein CLUP02_16015 [Colletotrichum lupini]UQC90485.1 hypothetical protein CLUP02_16015 [Colletotrichum lupini]